MKLSRDKINDLSHKLIAAMRKSRDVRLRKDPNDVRLEIVRQVQRYVAIAGANVPVCGHARSFQDAGVDRAVVRLQIQ